MRWFGVGPGEQVLQVPVDQIEPNPYQPRSSFDDARLGELADSIRQVGVIQPIVVRRLGNVYELIAGERRLRASKLAGLKTIPAIVKEYTDREVAQAALIENIQREDLNALEEAISYQKLIAEFEIKQEELALRLGKSQSTIANKLRLLNLSEPVKELLSAGNLNERQARALLRVKNEEEQLKLAQLAFEQGFNVQQTEQMIEEHLKGSSADEAAATTQKRIRRFIPKDVRLFLNSVKEAAKLMKQAGVKTEIVEDELDDCFSITVRIAKK